MSKKVFPLQDMDKIIRTAGAQRVSEEASKKLSEILEDSATELVFKAKLYAKHAGRNQLNRKDILLAKQL